MLRMAGFPIAATLVVMAGPASADTTSVAQGPAPAWVVNVDPLPAPADASGPVFVRLVNIQSHLDAEGQRTYLHQWMKILNSQALGVGNLAFQWDPSSGTPLVHTVRILRDGQVIDVLAHSHFEVIRQEQQLEQAALDGRLTASLRIPDLRVGDEVDVAYSLPAQDVTLGRLNAGALYLANQVLPGRYVMRLSWEDGAEPHVRTSPTLAGMIVRDAHSIELRADNPPSYAPPRLAPPRYALPRTLQFSDFSSWGQVSQTLYPLYQQASTLSAESPLRAEVARLAAAHSDPLERMQAALTLVQQQVRYIYVGMDGGNLRPAAADETWRRRFGDCKGKTALLLALLAGLGIEAEPVAVNQSGGDDGLDQFLPTPWGFDHVLVRARVGGKTYWLDGTLPDVAEASETPAVPYRWVLPLSAAGTELEHVPTVLPALPTVMGIYDIDARAGVDQPARQVTTVVTRGVAGLQEYANLSAITPDQLLTAMRNNADSGWEQIDSVNYRYDRATMASILSITGSVNLDWQSEGDGGRSLALPGGGFNPPERRQRSADQDQQAPYYSAPGFSCYTTTVRLPSNTNWLNWDIGDAISNRIFGSTYYRMFDRRPDATIRMVRTSRTEAIEISPEEARADNGRLANFDRSMAIIRYQPARRPPAVSRGTPVPAASDSQWLGDHPPCLPPTSTPAN